MEKTPKLPRKSLSLSSRINNKRHSASPQTRIRNVHTAAVAASGLNYAEATTPRSPSVISISSDGGIECTPPHKKFSFDDSLDYSPHALDSSFSPSGMFSQTLAIESPEVGWKWNHTKFDGNDKAAIETPDSAYAADSSFTSAESSSTEVFSTARTRSDSQRQRKKLDNRREEHRKALQQQQRKAEKLKIDEMLKRRCAKLQEQLQEVQRNTLLEKDEEATTSRKLNQPENKLKPTTSSPVISMSTRSSTASLQPAVSALSVNGNDSINDFFNDSESDGFLLEATQQVESQIVELTQTKSIAQSDVAANSPTLNTKSETDIVATTPKSSCKEKQRSSFYSKFLEDDSADDWFVALDDVVLQATQKPRTSFQRYKSMPIGTATSTSKSQTKESTTTTTGSTFASKVHTKDAVAKASTGSAIGLKRHASSHALSPSSTSYRSQNNQRKK